MSCGLTDGMLSMPTMVSKDNVVRRATSRAMRAGSRWQRLSALASSLGQSASARRSMFGGNALVPAPNSALVMCASPWVMVVITTGSR